MTNGQKENQVGHESVAQGRGCATGFCACSDIVDVQYKCTAIYNPKSESGIYPFDKDLNIKWPKNINETIMSEKDKNAYSFSKWIRTKESNVF